MNGKTEELLEILIGIAERELKQALARRGQAQRDFEFYEGVLTKLKMQRCTPSVKDSGQKRMFRFGCDQNIVRSIAYGTIMSLDRGPEQLYHVLTGDIIVFFSDSHSVTVEVTHSTPEKVDFKVISPMEKLPHAQNGEKNA